MHESFFFGPIERQLFGTYHPPSNAGGQKLTVLCPPLFAEYNRTHSILRKLSLSLAAQGHHVIRFDYSGTGDSFGSIENSTVDDWIQDIQLAVKEGFEISGCSSARVLGVRLGALLACISVREVRGVERLVLWDPVCEGSEYLRSLKIGLELTLSHNYFISRGDRLRAKSHYSAYNLSKRMDEDIRSLDTTAYNSIPSDKLRVVRTASSTEFPLGTVSQDVISVECQWGAEDEQLILSQPILESLVSMLVEP